MIPQDTLNEILDRIDLIEVISGYVPLKQTGKDYKGLCPFHQEKTPSFMVSPVKRIFHCFGCGEGGNLFTFVMKMENRSFPEVVTELAKKAGVPLKLTGDEDSHKREQKEVLYKINRYAAWYFSDQLAGSGGSRAQKYINKRKLTKESVATFKLGYAPDRWDGLVQFLKAKKVPLHEAVLLGLIRQRQDGSYYDFFRDRLMFPIMDFEGRMMGFGGRQLGNEKEAKYLNSPESPVYHKGHSIYGLFQAKKAIRERDEIILVEGYMDLIALHQAGVQNVVAPLGTALTVQQASFVGRWSRNFLLMFDGDEAGKRAMLKALFIFFQQKIHPRLLALPEGEDPDTFLDKYGASELKEGIAKARLAVEWMMLQTLGAAEPHARVAAVKKLLPYVQALPDALERTSYKTRLAQFIGVGEDALAGLAQTAEPQMPASKKTLSQILSPEAMLVGFLIQYCDTVSGLLKAGELALFEDLPLRDLAQTLIRQYEQTGVLHLDQVFGPASAYEVSDLVGFVFDEDAPLAPEEVKKWVQDCLFKLKQKRLKSFLNQLTGQIHLAEMAADAASLAKLILEKNEALKNLQALQVPVDWQEK